MSGYNSDKVDPATARMETMTYGDAIKLARMTVKQACEAAYRDTQLQIRDADKERQTVEDARSIHRNKNRAWVLVCGLTVSIIWPFIAIHLFKSQDLANFASALGYCGDLGVTFYALKRRY